MNNSERRVKGATDELDYNVFDCTSRKQIEACNKTIKQIAIYVGKEYGKNADLVKYVVEHEEDPDLDEPDDISPEDQKNCLKMFKWQESVKRYLDREEGLKTGKKKLYTLIWGQCTKVMQNELEATSLYEEMDRNQDPIALLKTIKSITYNFRDQKYLPGSMWRAYKVLYNTTQREEEDLKSFYDRFNNQVKVIENYGGNIGTDFNLYQQDKEYKELTESQKKQKSNIEAAKDRAKDRFLGYGLLANCDKKRYGNLVEDLDNTFTFGDDKYPSTQQKAYEYLMNYKKFKPKEKKNNQGRDGLSFATRNNYQNNRNNKYNNTNRGPRRCYGDRCYGNCDNSQCTAPGLANKANNNNNQVANAQVNHNQVNNQNRNTTSINETNNNNPNNNNDGNQNMGSKNPNNSKIYAIRALHIILDPQIEGVMLQISFSHY